MGAAPDCRHVCCSVALHCSSPSDSSHPRPSSAHSHTFRRTPQPCTSLHAMSEQHVGNGVAAAAAAVAAAPSVDEVASMPSQSLLSDKAILAHIAVGSVLIEPFSIDNLSTSR